MYYSKCAWHVGMWHQEQVKGGNCTPLLLSDETPLGAVSSSGVISTEETWTYWSWSRGRPQK